MSVDRGVTIGYFNQDVGDMAGRSAVAETMDGVGPVSVVAAELAVLEAAMADPDRRTISTRSSSAMARPRRASRSWTAMRWTGARARCWPASASPKR